MRLVAEPHIPIALWSALATVALIVWIWYAWQWRPSVTTTTRFGILALMALSLILPLIILLNLTWLQPVPPPAGKPVIHVLIDRSASMATKDAAGSTRFAEAAHIVSDMERQLASEFDLQYAMFDTDVVAVESDQVQSRVPDGQQTDLAAALRSVLGEDVPQGQAVVLLSDGINNASSVSDMLISAQLAQTLNIPVYPRTLGGAVGLKNVSVSLRSPQELSFIRQRIPVSVDVESRALVGAAIHVELVRDNKVVDQKEIVAEIDGRNEIEFEIGEDTAGLYRFQVRAAPIDGEATVDDNSATLLLRVVDRPVKVLLVEGKPYWDSKFLVRNSPAIRRSS